MQTLQVELPLRQYPIHVGSGLLAQIETLAGIEGRRRFIVTDETVAARYLPEVRTALDVDVTDCCVVPAGENSKCWTFVERVLDSMLARNLSRHAVVIALGGGVVGDLAGFCASIYQRGIDFVQVPTTLLAQVDSSVGGKTGINHGRGKNLIGSFHQPLAVIADTSTLASLPQREVTAGAAEIIKTAMLGDVPFFAWLESDLDAVMRRDPAALEQAILACCAAKARIVACDEYEKGARALLNLGHTFGHAVENFAGYGTVLHGEAVAIGLCMAADLSARMGMLSAIDRDRCIALVQRSGASIRAPFGMTPTNFMELMARDKKVVNGRVRLVLLRAIGEAFMSADYNPELLNQTLSAFCDSASALARPKAIAAARL